MSTAALQSVVARCLVDPQFLHALRLDPQTTLAAMPVDDDTRRLAQAVDLDGLENFLGLVVKVKHTALWSIFPATLTLLQRAKLDLRVFAAYAEPFLARSRAGPFPLPERAALFSAHLLSFLDANFGPATALIADMAAHESRLQRTDTEGDVPSAPSVAPHPVTPTCVPEIAGHLEIVRYRYDVVGLRADLAHVDPIELAEQPSVVGYWAPSGREGLRLLQLDPVSKVALALVDGRRTNKAVALALSSLGLSDAERHVEEFLTDAAAMGVLTRCRFADPDHEEIPCGSS